MIDRLNNWCLTPTLAVFHIHCTCMRNKIMCLYAGFIIQIKDIHVLKDKSIYLERMSLLFYKFQNCVAFDICK